MLPPTIPQRTSSLLPSGHQSPTATEPSIDVELSRLTLSKAPQKDQIKYLDGRIAAMEKEDACLQRDQLSVQDDFQKSPQEAFQNHYNRSFGSRARIAAEYVVVRRQRQKVLDLLADKEYASKTETGLAYTLIMNQLYEDSAIPKITAIEQTDFANRVFEWYNTIEPSSKGYWCPIIQRYGKKNDRCPATMAPYSVGYDNITYLFGEEKHSGVRFVWRYQNTSVMDKGLSAAFDKGAFVLIPSPPKNNEPSDAPLRWKVALLLDSRIDETVGDSSYTYSVR